MIKSQHIKTGFRFFLTVCLLILKITWHTLVIIISFLAGCADTDEDDFDDESLTGGHFNYLTGELDPIKRSDGIYDERKF